MAELYDTIINEVVKDIGDALESFQQNVTALQTDAEAIDFDSIINNLTSVITGLPGSVIALRGTGRRLLNIIGQFEDLPPVVGNITELVLYVSDLFNDIKTDVMNMYNVSIYIHGCIRACQRADRCSKKMTIMLMQRLVIF